MCRYFFNLYTTMYSQYHYIYKIGILLVVIYFWENNNITCCSYFFMAGLDEMKSGIHRVETVNAGMGLYWLLKNLFLLLLRETIHSTTARVYKIQFTGKFSIIIHSSLCILLASLIILAKSLIGKNWNVIRRK